MLAKFVKFQSTDCKNELYHLKACNRLIRRFSNLLSCQSIIKLDAQNNMRKVKVGSHYLLYEYRDLRVVLDWNKIRISLHTIFFTCEICRRSVLIGCTIFFTCEKKAVWAFWLADILLPKKCNTCLQVNVNMESDFVRNFSTHWGERFMIFCQ